MTCLLQRYVFLETLKVFALAICVSTLIMTLGVGANEGIKRGVPFAVTMQIMPFVIPETLRMTVPAALLFSVCTVFGRMAADGELTAAKSLGIHPFRLILPVVVIAALLSYGTFTMYEVCATWARPNLKRTLLAAVDEIAYQKLRSEGVLSTKDATLTVRGVSGRSLLEPRMQISRAGEEVTVEAARATLSEVGHTGLLRVDCQQLTFQQSAYEGELPGAYQYDLRLQEPDHKDPRQYSPAELASHQLADQVRHERGKIQSLQKMNRLVETQTTNASRAMAADISQQMTTREKRLFRLEAEYQRRLSNGFATLAFTLIGIPIAVSKQSRDNMSIFFLCIAPIAILYYPLLVLGETIAKGGILPQFAVWLAPGVLIVVGCVMLRNLLRR